MVKEVIWQNLRFMRVYLKPKNEQPDFETPLVLKKGQTVARVAEKIFPGRTEFKQILLWGSSAQFPGQQVSLRHRLKDEDVLSFN